MTTIQKFENHELSFDKLINEGRDRLKSYALKLTHNKDDAEDLFQDTCLKIYLNLNQVDDESKFLHWALRVMYFKFLDNNRAKGRRITSVSIEEMSQTLGIEFEMEDKSVDIESEVMLKMIQEMNSAQLKRMISSINPVYSTTLSLNTYGKTIPLIFDNTDTHELDLHEISAHTGVKFDTIRTRMSRGRKALRDIANPDDFILE